MIELPVIFASVVSLLARSEIDLNVTAEQEQEGDRTYSRATLKLHHKPTGSQWSQECLGRTLDRACHGAWTELLERVGEANPDLRVLLNSVMWMAIKQHSYGG